MLFSYFHWEHIWLKNFFWKGIQCWAEDIYVPIFNPQCFLKNACSALLLQDFTNSSSWMISFRSWYTWIGCCCLYVFCTNTDWFREKFHWGYYRKQIPRHSTPSSQKKHIVGRDWKKKSQKTVESTTINSFDGILLPRPWPVFLVCHYWSHSSEWKTCPARRQPY